MDADESEITLSGKLDEWSGSVNVHWRFERFSPSPEVEPVIDRVDLARVLGDCRPRPGRAPLASRPLTGSPSGASGVSRGHPNGLACPRYGRQASLPPV